MACGILVPWPGITTMPTAVEAQSLNHWTTGVVPEISFLEKAFLPKAQQERRKGGVMVKGNVKLLKSSVLLLFFVASQDWGFAALHLLLLLHRRHLDLRSQDTRAERLSSRKTYPPSVHYFSHKPPNLQHLQHLGHLSACRQEAQPNSARSSTPRVSEQFSKPWHERNKTHQHRPGLEKTQNGIRFCNHSQLLLCCLFWGKYNFNVLNLYSMTTKLYTLCL